MQNFDLEFWATILSQNFHCRKWKYEWIIWYLTKIWCLELLHLALVLWLYLVEPKKYQKIARMYNRKNRFQKPSYQYGGRNRTFCWCPSILISLKLAAIWKKCWTGLYLNWPVSNWPVSELARPVNWPVFSRRKFQASLSASGQFNRLRPGNWPADE